MHFGVHIERLGRLNRLRVVSFQSFALVQIEIEAIQAMVTVPIARVV